MLHWLRERLEHLGQESQAMPFVDPATGDALLCFEKEVRQKGTVFKLMFGMCKHALIELTEKSMTFQIPPPESYHCLKVTPELGGTITDFIYDCEEGALNSVYAFDSTKKNNARERSDKETVFSLIVCGRKVNPSAYNIAIKERVISNEGKITEELLVVLSGFHKDISDLLQTCETWRKKKAKCELSCSVDETMYLPEDWRLFRMVINESLSHYSLTNAVSLLSVARGTRPHTFIWSFGMDITHFPNVNGMSLINKGNERWKEMDVYDPLVIKMDGKDNNFFLVSPAGDIVSNIGILYEVDMTIGAKSDEDDSLSNNDTDTGMSYLCASLRWKWMTNKM